VRCGHTEHLLKEGSWVSVYPMTSEGSCGISDWCGATLFFEGGSVRKGSMPLLGIFFNFYRQSSRMRSMWLSIKRGARAP